MQRTIKIKLKQNPALVKTLQTASKVRQLVCTFGYNIQTDDKNELHKLTYSKIRKQYPEFPSALVQTSRDVAVEALKRNKLSKRINVKPMSALRYNKRCLRVSLEHKTISISSVKGRLKFDFNSNKQLDKYLDWKPKAGMLVYRNNNLFLNLVVEKEAPVRQKASEQDVLGIDRGINNILVCSDNQFFNSKELKRVKGKYQHLKQVLQSKGTDSANRKLKTISGKERRFVTDMNHCLSKVIAESDFKVFALERLRRMTKKSNGKRFNRKLGNWSFSEFESFLNYKAEALGKHIVKVNPAYTSQKCSNCNIIKKSNRKGSWYSCGCGFQLHSDLNASRNIANLGISEFSRLSVNQPNVTSNDSYKSTSLEVGS